MSGKDLPVDGAIVRTVSHVPTVCRGEHVTVLPGCGVDVVDPADDRPAHEHHDCRFRVICAAVAVFQRGAPELRHADHEGVIPDWPEIVIERGEGKTEIFGKIGKPEVFATVCVVSILVATGDL